MSNYKLLTEPLTAKDADAEGWVKGVVPVNLSEIINHEEDEFLDILSERLVGDCMLREFDYRVVGFDKSGTELHIEVCGDAKLSFDL